MSHVDEEDNCNCKEINDNLNFQNEKKEKRSNGEGNEKILPNYCFCWLTINMSYLVGKTFHVRPKKFEEALGNNLPGYESSRRGFKNFDA